MLPQALRYVLDDGTHIGAFGVRAVRCASQIFSVLDYSKGFGHTDLIPLFGA
jgi:hypothetical protein